MYLKKIQRLVSESVLPFRLIHVNRRSAGSMEASRLVDKVFEYVQSNRVPGGDPAYYFNRSADEPVLYASCYAALTLSLLGKLSGLSDLEKKRWSQYLMTFQCEDGLFRDHVINNDLSETADWWGTRLLTVHVLMALASLDQKAPRPFKIIQQYKSRGRISEWLSQLDWCHNADFSSNAVQNLGCLLQYARDFQNDREAAEALDEMFSWFDRFQDPDTGLWGGAGKTRRALSRSVQAFYHIALLYFYDHRRLNVVPRIIDSLIATQNLIGGFGVRWSSSACEDIDTLDPLLRLGTGSAYRSEDIRKTIDKAIPWVMANMNEDGGFVFRRCTDFEYGHPKMYAGIDQSSMFATWFRTLSLALAGYYCKDTWIGQYPWNFIRCPGMQFIGI